MSQTMPAFKLIIFDQASFSIPVLTKYYHTKVNVKSWRKYLKTENDIGEALDII